eukprot:TRINITY_DN33920_c0_g1_i1.p1 TRINITY_DN33920_c0_g1~~TRINITY_DN33920_c0_g1_i1.p1  ORF type:complete len:199 (+),score=40.61 TRINITY_DN33920_c0_g1_i1:103-699(+)
MCIRDRFYLLSCCRCARLFPAANTLTLVVAALTVNYNHPGCGLLVFASPDAVFGAKEELAARLQKQAKAVFSLLKECRVLSKMTAGQQSAFGHQLAACYERFFNTEERLVEDHQDDTIQQLIIRHVQLNPRLTLTNTCSVGKARAASLRMIPRFFRFSWTSPSDPRLIVPGVALTASDRSAYIMGCNQAPGGVTERVR